MKSLNADVGASSFVHVDVAIYDLILTNAWDYTCAHTNN